jgi:hypothetical protein
MLQQAPSSGRPHEGAVTAHSDTEDRVLGAWVEAIDAAFAEGIANAGESTRTFRIADGVLRLAAAGDGMLSQLGRAFSHLSDARGARPELTVCLWDSATTGVDPPPFPQANPDMPRGGVLYSSAGRRRVAYQPGLSLMSALDLERSTAWFWCADAARLPYWERAAPLRQILHWWLSPRGSQLLHGAAVGTEDGGVLLVGRGGSGKSTCALSSLASELLYAGDDYVAVRDGPDPWVFGLYGSGKLVPGHARLLPHLPPPSFQADESLDEKAVFFVHEHFQDRTSEGFPLRAILMPKVTGTARPRMVTVDSANALRALAPTTLMQLHPPFPDALARMAALLQQLPTYVFEVGDIEETPKAIARFLGDLRLEREHATAHG